MIMSVVAKELFKDKDHLRSLMDVSLTVFCVFLKSCIMIVYYNVLCM